MDVLPENSMELLELVIEVWRCLTLVYSIQFEAGLNSNAQDIIAFRDQSATIRPEYATQMRCGLLQLHRHCHMASCSPKCNRLALQVVFLI